MTKRTWIEESYNNFVSHDGLWQIGPSRHPKGWCLIDLTAPAPTETTNVRVPFAGTKTDCKAYAAAHTTYGPRPLAI